MYFTLIITLPHLFSEITINMLRQMNSLGIFKNDDIWFPTYYTYNTCWNYSDSSEKLARVSDSHVTCLWWFYMPVVMLYDG